jgi:uncharacterized surface protein with fasciclin (FAS1) repeats
MIKKSLLSVWFVCNALILFGQASPAQITDSVKVTSVKKNIHTLKIADGANMLPANDVATNLALSNLHHVFYRAIQAAQHNETFKSRGPITVFAPTDQAFANLPPGKLDTLLSEAHKYDLIALITYHAIAGRITAKNITHEIIAHKGLATFIMLNGSKLTAKLDANRNIILIDENGGQSVITRFNIEQSNGLIHSINGVLIPKFKNI